MRAFRGLKDEHSSQQSDADTVVLNDNDSLMDVESDEETDNVWFPGRLHPDLRITICEVDFSKVTLHG